MRLKIEFIPIDSVAWSEIKRHHVQGFIYSTLRGTEFDRIHNMRTFKFFNYSNIFPPGDLVAGKQKNLLISSPNEGFIRVLTQILEEKTQFILNNYVFQIVGLKVFNIKPKHIFKTATPIVLRRNNTNEYVRVKSEGGVFNFIKELNKTEIIKYERYFGEPPVKGLIFDRYEITGQYSYPVKFGDYETHVVGNMATFYKLSYKRDQKFYQFLLDVGLGIRNSYGFGFLNTY